MSRLPRMPTGMIGAPVLAAVRAALDDDLDTPGALAAIDVAAAEGGPLDAACALLGITL